MNSSVIECCLHNLDATANQQLRRSDCPTRIAPCLGHCGHCRRGPFAVIDGTFRLVDDHRDLLTIADGGDQ